VSALACSRRWRERFEPELAGDTQQSHGEREEVERLRRELRELQAENMLLKKAAALFAKDVKLPCTSSFTRRGTTSR
jgi:transposase-like protein